MKRTATRRTASRLLGISVLAAASAVAVLGAQAPARPLAPAQGQGPVLLPKGTGLVLGQVIDALTGRPVAGAVVDFSGRATVGPTSGSVSSRGTGPGAAPSTPTQPSQRVITDAEGRFMFHDLPKATYTFNASAPGYLGGGYGQKSPNGPSRPYDLGEAERTSDVKLMLWKYSTISGTVVDETGEPVVGASVRSFRRSMVNGKPRLSISNQMQTDDRGAYRMSSLSPGDYIIGIMSTQTTLAAASIDAYQQLAQQGGSAMSDFSRDLSTSGAPFPGASGVRVGDYFLQSASNSGRSVMIPPPDASGRIAVYAPLFYPTANSAAQSTPIRLASGEERSGIDLQLRLVPAFRVSGTVTGPGGPMPNIGVHLMQANADELAAYESLETATTATDATGTFTLLGVPPGQYIARVDKVPRPAAPVPPVPIAGGGLLQLRAVTPSAPPVGSDLTLWAQSPVTVGDQDVAGVPLVVRPGLRVMGTARFEGMSAQRPTADQLQRMTVSLSPADSRGVVQFPPPARGTTTGQFTTSGYAPGRYYMSASLPVQGWFLKAVTLGGRDLSETPLELDSDVSGVAIVFSDQQTTLAGTVRDTKNPTNVDATVVVFPFDYGTWIASGMSGRRTRSTRTAKSGAFALGSLPPGAYLIVAVTDEPDRDLQDGRYYTALAGLATRLSIAEGEKHTSDLTSVKAPDVSRLPSPVAPPVTEATSADSTEHGPFVEADEQQVEPPLQLPARDTVSRPSTGTAVLTGTITSDDGSNRPIRRASVNVIGGDLRGQRTAITDDAGHFVLGGLPAGRFSLSASKAAYVNTVYGQAKPGMPSTPLTLAAGEHQDVSMKLSRGAVITGTIFGANGQPAQNVQVMLLQYRMTSGERQLYQTGSNGNNSTDDRGVYRLYGLTPGEYLVAVEYLVAANSRGGNQADAHPITQADIQWAQQALRQTGTAAAGMSATSAPLTPAPAPGQALGYSAVFYPGSADPAGAALVSVRAGEEKTGVDFPMMLVPTARLEGRLLRPDGQPAVNSPNLQLNLVPKAFPATIRTLFVPTLTRYQQDGRFSASAVPPGEYTITARLSAMPPAPPPQQGARPVAQQQATLWAMTDVVVSGADVTDVVVSLQPGMTVSGRIAFAGRTLPAPADLTRVRVSLQAIQPPSGGLAASVPAISAEADGTFTFTSVTPGRYRLSASVSSTPIGPPPPGRGMPGGPVPGVGPVPAAPASPVSPPDLAGRGGVPGGLPSGVRSGGPGNLQPSWTLKSAVLNGQDTLDFPFDVRPSENVAGALMTLSDQSTEISGSLVDQAGKPATDYSIIVFASDRAFWTSTSRRIRQTRPNTDGMFRIAGLPPGEYLFCAVTEFDTGQLNDPAFLDSLVSVSFKMPLAEGEKKTQNLKLARTPAPVAAAGPRATGRAPR
jgi:protocatechuate 3,4-dioxygenase beta subunit